MFLDHPFIGNSMLIPDYGCSGKQSTQPLLGALETWEPLPLSTAKQANALEFRLVSQIQTMVSPNFISMSKCLKLRMQHQERP